MTKVEYGDPTVSAGTYFEAATIVDVPLFDDAEARKRHGASKLTELALLPSSARRPKQVVDDDF